MRRMAAWYPTIAIAAVTLGSCQRGQDLSDSSFVTMADNTFSPTLMKIPVGDRLNDRLTGQPNDGR